MRLRDISWPIGPSMPSYPGDPAFGIELVARHEREGFAVRALRLGTHTGTHVDAPAHVLPHGWTVDEIPIDWLCGPARVLDARCAGRHIDESFFDRAALDGVERLLLRTASESLPRDRYDPAHPALTPGAARRLASSGALRLVGFDYLTLEADGAPDLPVHRALLGADPPIVLLEALDLRDVEAGDYELWCLPLRLAGADGAPARAVLAPRAPHGRPGAA